MGLDNLPAKQSLAALTKYAFSLAQDKLLLVSPFLDEDSAKWLSTALKGATKRHVRVYLISHGLNEGNEQIKRTLAIYRDSTPDIRIFTTAKRKKPSYFLLHAKLTIADVKYAVLSTANLTQYGLRSHLEVGVGLTGEPVRHLEQLISQLLLTNLVEEVR